MRAWFWGVLAIGVFVAVGCEDDDTTTPSGAGATHAGTATTGTGDDSGPVCEPGRAVACLCPGRRMGVTTCLPDGSGWGPCEECPPVGGAGGSGGGECPPPPGNPCEGQVNLGLGETPECQGCILECCCPEYQTCASGASCDALLACGSVDGWCGDECFYRVCTTPFGYTFWKDCTDCLSANCCSEYEACWVDENCRSCLLLEVHNLTACQGTTLDEETLHCVSNSCCDACDGLWLGECG